VTLQALFRAYLVAVESEQERLDRLDAVAGDGDHGATMVLAMRAVATSIPDDGASPASVLRAAAEAFATVGGSIGPLWGTGLLRAARAVEAGADPARAVEAAVVGVQERGGSELGDKTLLDVLIPASAVFSDALAARGELADALQIAAAAAGAALRSSASLPARRGRARRTPERSVGTLDPGAASACLAWSVAASAAGVGQQ
jgi:dihydroxyacetone kinase-like protein